MVKVKAEAFKQNESMYITKRGARRRVTTAAGEWAAAVRAACIGSVLCAARGRWEWLCESSGHMAGALNC